MKKQSVNVFLKLKESVFFQRLPGKIQKRLDSTSLSVSVCINMEWKAGKFRSAIKDVIQLSTG